MTAEIRAVLREQPYLSGGMPLDLEELRARLRGMSDNELRRFGRAARYVCSPEAHGGKSPPKESVVQLEEARLEWQRRTIERKAATRDQTRR